MKKGRPRLATAYDNTYEHFDSDLMHQVRREALTEDIGQHSWITADELRRYLAWLELSTESTLLDFGCGPGGPLTFTVEHSGCAAIGIDMNNTALQLARRRIQGLRQTGGMHLVRGDADQPLPFTDGVFDAVISIDVVLHLKDRGSVLGEIARVLRPGGKLVFTDAGIINGPISNEEIRVRSNNGFSQFVCDGYNDEVLSRTGLDLVEKEVNNTGAVENARGRIRTRSKYAARLKRVQGKEDFEQEQLYLQAMVDLYQRGALTRLSYCAVKR